MRQVHTESHGIYGSEKIAAALSERDDLESDCRNIVASATQELGLRIRVSRGVTPTTTQADPTKQLAPNVLARDFTADAPNRKWTTDISYLPAVEGWVYLALVMDLFSRIIVGWSIGDSLATETVADALRQAIEARRSDGQQLLHHSDRGCQYTSDAYQQTLRLRGITCSMSRTGNCYDNAAMERFFLSLKHEWTKHEKFDAQQADRLSVFKYIETFYNSERLHQNLGYQSSTQFEADHALARAA